MIEWNETTLSEIIEIIGGGTPKTSNPEYWNGDIPWLSVVDFNNNRKFVETTEKSITKHGLLNSSTKLLREGDIIISTRGTVGAIAVLKRDMAFNQSCYGIRPIQKIADTDFVYYLIKGSIESLVQISHGGVFDTITRESFQAIKIPLPPLQEQKAIAGVLSSLDEKIDLLYRQNKTLEAIAEIMFRQWFIERAEDNWEVVELKDIIVLQSGFSFKSKNYQEIGKYQIVTIKAVQDGYLELKNANRISSIPVNMPSHCNLFLGDILLSLTGNVGRCCLVDEYDLLLNQRVAKIVPEDGFRSFIYVFFRKQETRNQLEDLAKGTAQQNLSPIETSKMKITLPPSKPLDEFNAVVEPILDRLLLNKILIKHIVKLRDTLLPKLKSGEVRVDY